MALHNERSTKSMVKRMAMVLMTGASLGASQVTTLVFDLGGIFLDVKESGYIRPLGIGTLIGYCALDRQNPFKLSKVVFEVLESIPLDQDKNLKRTYRKSGIELPYIMCAWQAGTVSSSQAVTLANETIQRLSDKGYFASPRQELLVRRTIETMFDPKIHARLTYCYKASCNLLKEIARQCNPDGTKKYRLVALSNWDTESFEYVKAKFAKELAPFDEIVISGDIGTIKPNNAAFDCAIQVCCAPKQQCIFIDDQKENVKAGADYGFCHSICYTSASALRSQLQELGVLPPSRFKRFSVTPKLVLAAGAALAGVTWFVSKLFQ